MLQNIVVNVRSKSFWASERTFTYLSDSVSVFLTLFLFSHFTEISKNSLICSVLNLNLPYLRPKLLPDAFVRSKSLYASLYDRF